MCSAVNGHLACVRVIAPSNTDALLSKRSPTTYGRARPHAHRQLHASHFRTADEAWCWPSRQARGKQRVPAAYAKHRVKLTKPCMANGGKPRATRRCSVAAGVCATWQQFCLSRAPLLVSKFHGRLTIALRITKIAIDQHDGIAALTLNLNSTRKSDSTCTSTADPFLSDRSPTSLLQDPHGFYNVSRLSQRRVAAEQRARARIVRIHQHTLIRPLGAVCALDTVRLCLSRPSRRRSRGETAASTASRPRFGSRRLSWLVVARCASCCECAVESQRSEPCTRAHAAALLAARLLRSSVRHGRIHDRPGRPSQWQRRSHSVVAHVSALQNCSCRKAVAAQPTGNVAVGCSADARIGRAWKSLL